MLLRHGLRLAGNLLTSRLLFPEAFGVIAIVNAVTQGAELVLDIGVGASVIQDKEGHTRVFLNTAWTVQALRGIVLWAGCCFAAWPLSVVYGHGELLSLLPAASTAVLISGFNSTALLTLNRKLSMGKLTLLEVACQTVGIGVMVLWALAKPSPWALVGGNLAACGLRLVAGHLLAARQGTADRFAWDGEAARRMMTFGKWIIASSILGFFVMQGDRLILGRLLSIGELGLYTLAATIAAVPEQVHRAISGRVLFPVFARYAESSREELRRKVREARAAMMVLVLPPLWALAIWGGDVVRFLYDGRYHDAAWMVRVLAGGSIAAVIPLSGPVVLALGESRQLAWLLAVRCFLLIAAIAAGGWLAGSKGLVLGVAGTPVLQYPVEAWMLRRHSVWTPELDLTGFVLSAAVLGVGAWLH